ncbi:MAG: UDP-glucose dehydrogenase family protein [Terriglobia bacterium]
MKIAVIGAGYVGLTTAACLAEVGHNVFCAESQPEKLISLKAGQMPLFEPYLEDLIAKNRDSRRLQFGPTEEAVAACEILFICVGTPLTGTGEVDVSAVERVAQTISQTAHGYRLIVQKSTVPVGSCSQLHELLAKNLPARNGHSAFHWDVVANPEFLCEGSAVEDFLHPSRIVIGADNPEAAETLKGIYSYILQGKFACPIHGARHDGEQPAPLVIADTRTAELIKHTANSFLAMKVSFVNMVADLCEAAGGDIEKVIEGIGLDQRIGPAFLKPGIGFGGSCFPKDVQGFIQVAEKFGCDFSLLKEVERINAERVGRFLAKIKDELGDLRGKKIGVWGLAFKPNTDDIRNSPSIAIVRRLLAEGAEIQAYDPQAIGRAKQELPDVFFCRDAYEAAVGAEALLALTAWDEFSSADLSRVRADMLRPLIFDGRNMFSEEKLTALGFAHIRVGRAPLAPDSAPKVCRG